MIGRLSETAAAGGRHLGPGGMVAVGSALLVIFGAWAIWPDSIVRLNTWLSTFRVIRAMANTPPGGRPRPSNRRIRTVASIGVLCAIALLIAGATRW